MNSMTQDDRITPTGELVLMDEETQHAIYWNGSATFNVWSVLGNSFSFRPLREVNVMTNYLNADQSPVLPLVQAQRAARWWWDEYGRENTLELEREGL